MFRNCDLGVPLPGILSPDGILDCCLARGAVPRSKSALEGLASPVYFIVFKNSSPFDWDSFVKLSVNGCRK